MDPALPGCACTRDPSSCVCNKPTHKIMPQASDVSQQRDDQIVITTNTASTHSQDLHGPAGHCGGLGSRLCGDRLTASPHPRTDDIELDPQLLEDVVGRELLDLTPDF
eukprot:7863374-Lingulodinium_polyedra.AAC.1